MKKASPRQSARVRTPTVLQMEAVECGAAALAMVLGGFGRYEPLEKLRIDCGVSRDGSKASNVLKAARAYGLLAKGYKKEPRQLRTMPLPLIAFWNFNHYLVVEGFGKGKVYLNDPAEGPRTVTDAEFDEAFTGVALVFEKGPHFRRGGARPGVLTSLAARLRGSLVPLVFLVAASLGLALPGLVIPAFARVFLDQVLVGGQQAWMRPLLVAMGVTAVIRGGLTWLQQNTLLRLESKLSIGGSARFFWHILSLPIEFFSQRYAGDIVRRVALNDQIASLLAGDLATNFANVLMAVFYAALMYRYDRPLTVVAVSLAAVNIVVLRSISRRRKDANRTLMQAHGKFLGVSMGGLQMIETYKASGSENEFFSLWAGHQAKVLNTTQKIGGSSLVLTILPPLLTSVNVVAILWAGGLRAMDGFLTLGMLLAFQGLVALFIEPVNRLVDLGGKLQEAEADMSCIDDVLNYPVAPRAVVPAGMASDTPVETANGLLGWHASQRVSAHGV